ncbi:MAG: hypothetical protein M3Y91_18645, partial [Actinomycetota bacterium]|nr:hypothetical protein [Actinomycetota bacterium]
MWWRGLGTRIATGLRVGAEAFAAAASRRGVRVVYLGGLGDREVSAGRSAHLRSRHEVGVV